EVDAGDFSIDAHRKVSTPALFAHKTMAAMPTYPHALPFSPCSDVVADYIDASRNFMTWHTRILEPGPETFLHKGVAMANAACFNFHAYLSSVRLRNSRSTNSQSPPGLLICATFIFVVITAPIHYEYH